MKQSASRWLSLPASAYLRWLLRGNKWQRATAMVGSLLAIVLFIGALQRDSDAPTPEAANDLPPGTQARVVRVIDGDTVEVELAQEGKATVRYIGVDTPESVAPGRPVGCFAREASAKNESLVLGKAVYLEKDVSETDSFRRLLRYVYLESGEMVNELLVREGYATAVTYPPDVKYEARFLAAQEEARKARRGLWSACVAVEAAPTTPTARPQEAQPSATPRPTAPPPAAPAAAPPAPTTVIPPAPPPPTQPPAASSSPSAGAGGGVPPVSASECPSSHPIKGNESSRGELIYHVPGGSAYNRTNPERCFATPADAERAGYRAVQN